MFRRSLTAVGLVVTTAASARAQNFGDYAAYFALRITPQGAFAPLPPALGAGSGFGIRYSRVDAEGGAVNSFAGIGRFGTTRGAGSITAGVLTCGGCDAVLSLGGEFDLMLAQAGDETARFAIGLRPAIGFAISPGDGDGTALTASLGAPISVTAGTEVRVAPFVVPGFGFGRISSGGDAESGLRPMIGFGSRCRMPPAPSREASACRR